MNRFICCILMSLSVFAAMYSMEASGAEATKVSLINLIARPTSFEGKLIEVDGFASTGFEAGTLYLTKGDLNYAIRLNGIELSIENKYLTKFRQYNGKCCRVVGKFFNKNKKSNDEFIGALEVFSMSELNEVKVQSRDSIVKQLGVVEYLMLTGQGDKAELTSQHKDLLKQLEAYK